MLVLNEMDLVGLGYWEGGLSGQLGFGLVVPEASVLVAWCLKNEAVGFGDDGLVLREEGFTSVIAQLSHRDQGGV